MMPIRADVHSRYLLSLMPFCLPSFLMNDKSSWDKQVLQLHERDGPPRNENDPYTPHSGGRSASRQPSTIVSASEGLYISNRLLTRVSSMRFLHDFMRCTRFITSHHLISRRELLGYTAMLSRIALRIMAECVDVVARVVQLCACCNLTTGRC
jgi:hypothetical protein